MARCNASLADRPRGQPAQDGQSRVGQREAVQRDADGSQAARELEVERAANGGGIEPLAVQQRARGELRLGRQGEEQVLRLYA